MAHIVILITRRKTARITGTGKVIVARRPSQVKGMMGIVTMARWPALGKRITTVKRWRRNM
jgi:hypothetical protein